MSPLVIDVWSDLACPWCYVGKRRLERALTSFDGEVVLRRRSFELDPTAPRVAPPLRYAERLARKYGTSIERAEQMLDTMTAAGATDGLDLRFDRVRPGNTFDAHRLLHLAAERELDDALEERLFRAYLTEGEALGERATLARLADEIGLDPDRVSAVLDADEYGDAVRADETEAQKRGIHGVPFFLLGDRLGLSGAQPPEVMLEALSRVGVR